VHAGDNRALAWATLASLALHAVLVVGWPRVQERLRPASPPPIVSRLVEAPPAPAPPRAVEPALVPTPPPEKKRRTVEKPAPKSIERAVTPQSREELAEPRPVPPPPAPPSPPAAMVTPAPSPPGPAVAPAPQATPPAVDMATTIAQYRMQVLSAARRLKSRYPDIARENNWTGSVVIALAIGTDGMPEVRLKSGTGHAPLDQQASDMFRQAARSVPVPPALQGRAFSVDLRAVYGLID
jgi:TonB family protein